MRQLFIISALILTMSAAGAACKLKSESVKVGWKAYKTPLKVGVGGAFDKFSITNSKELKGSSPAEFIKGATFTIDAMSVNTKNKARDKKIAKNFFSSMKGGSEFSGSIKEVNKKKKVIIMTLKGNGVEKEVPMAYEVKDGKFSAIGNIDVLDFSLNSQLKAINKACFALHEGKTWSDVEISLSAMLSGC